MFGKLSLLFVEPYYGGSHRVFADELCARSPHDVSLVTAPPRKWKWRMRGGAVNAAEETASRLLGGSRFDLIIASSMLNVAEYLGLIRRYVSPLPPVLLVMHENQLVYPNQARDERDIHFGLTNLTSCLAADRIAWNSRFNLESFVKGATELIRDMPDERPARVVGAIEEKSIVLPPPLSIGEDLDAMGAPVPRSRGSAPTGIDGPPKILWNHRWEHDKGPEAFFEGLYRLKDAGIDFRLSVLGESFTRVPPCFAEARNRLDEHITDWGFQPSRQDYLRTLLTCDIVVSSARHEFYGMSVLEAVAAGCRPVLPRRLSYPELVPDKFLYEDDEDLYPALKRALAEVDGGSTGEGRQGADLAAFARPYFWESLAPRWWRLIEETAALL